MANLDVGMYALTPNRIPTGSPRTTTFAGRAFRAVALAASIFAGSLGAVPAARAALVCQAGICDAYLDTGVQGTELDTDLLFPLFDSNLGTLTSVSVVITSQLFISNSWVTNTSANAKSFSASEFSIFTLADTSEPGSALDNALANVALMPSYTQRYTLAGHTSAVFGPYNPFATYSLAGPLAAFQVPGGETDVVNVATMTGITFIGGGGKAAANIDTNGEATIAVEYTYAPRLSAFNVSESSSLSLLGIALVGIGWVRQRKSRSFE